jgi:pimeloyl-ACP methyl ester carboxylesterase
MAAEGRDPLAAALAGKELAYGGRPPDSKLAERMLEPVTGWLRGAAEKLPGLREIDLDAALAALEHEWLEVGGLIHHAELHRARTKRCGTAVFVHGLGDHVRRATPLGAALAAAGWDALLVDRRGHGLSEGRRGDAAIEDDFAAVRAALDRARELGGGPVVLLGDSLGGILSWYMLAEGVAADAVVCHCINHPDVDHDPSLRWKRPITRAVAAILPRAPVPVTQIADYSQVALEPLTSAYFEQRLDPLFNFTVTARAASSYASFRPSRPWAQAQTPVLVVMGADDRMVSPAHVERCLERERPPHATMLTLPGMGHQLFLDHLADALPPVLEWVEGTLAPGDA